MASAPVVEPIKGFIRPPPEIRAIADKTAAFVARNGPEFETKIMADKGTDPKFAFLQSSNPYHAYYRHKVEEARAPPPPVPPAEPAAAADAAAPAAAAADSSAAASSSSAAAAAAAPAAPAPPAARRPDVLPNPLSRALKAVDLAGPPPATEFAIITPPYASPETVDVIRLTAQYTAVAGRPFLAGLAQRESRNPLFDFLRPSHALFHYFTACVDAYGRALRPSVATLERLARDAGGRGELLQRCVARYAHAQAAEERRAGDAEAAAAERSSLTAVDWHDAVLVETVPFPEGGADADELADLPPPLPHPAKALAAAAAAGGGSSALVSVKASADGGVTVVPRMVVKPSAETAAQLAVAVAEGLSSAPPPASAGAGAADDDQDEEEEEPLRVVADYVPSLPTAPSHAPAVTSYVDPRTGAAIPIEAAGRHMRIETLDPRWAEQRAKHAARQAGTLLAGGDEVAENLQRLAASRADVFAPERDAAAEAEGGGAPAAKRARQGDA